MIIAISSSEDKKIKTEIWILSVKGRRKGECGKNEAG
jgi:hypothetical protein